MGSTAFRIEAHGGTPDQAFRNAGGGAGGECTGTITSKDSFEECDLADGRDPEELVDEAMADDEHPCQSAWGPACCVRVGDLEWLFFGWAPS